MAIIHRFSAAAAAFLMLSGAALADDEHHPPSAPGVTEAQPQPKSASPSMPGGMGSTQMRQGMDPGGMTGMMQPGGSTGMSGMMGPDMMQMMNMMQMMGMAGGPGGAMGMSARAMTEHVEGRIAFLRTELKITDAQSRDWSQFADALRANAKSLSQAGASIMPKAGALTLPQRLDREQRALEARVEGTRTLKLALDRLYPTLSEEQKTIADRIMPPHIGMMPMARM